MPIIEKHRTLLVACVMFFGLGLATAALGPFLPELATNTSSSLSEVGVIFTMLFLGALLSQLIAGPLMDRLGQRPVLLAGLVLISAGVLGISLSRSLRLTLACALVGGCGHGAIDVGGNVMIAEAYSARRVSALNLLNVFFGLGAVTGPAISSLTLQIWSSAVPPLWLSILLLFLLIPFIYTSVNARVSSPFRPHEDRRAIYRVPVLWAFGLVLLIYVGAENGIGGWTTIYIDRTTALGLDRAALVTSGFWLTLTAGRMLAVLVGGQLASGRVLGLSLGGSLLGGVLLMLSTGNAPLSIAAVLILGLFFGPIFPTVVAITTARFPGGPGQAASVVVVLGSIGGMLLPWMQGTLLEKSGPFAASLFVAAATASMLLLFGVVRLVGRRA
jgi:MFS transporter, FHS family, glucose/mannose:H+ symporter